MGRFVYWMNVSLDLKIERTPTDHVDGEDGGSWLRITERLHREFNARARGLSLMVQGRTMYEMMDPFWPDAREDESQPDYLREYGEIWTSMPKVLVSRTRTSAQHNTRIVGGEDAIEQLAAIRARTDGDIGVGGATLGTQLLRANLLDELMLFTHPVILGEGRPLFDGTVTDGTVTDGTIESMELDLLEQASFPEGVTLHRYAVRGARPAS
jgi:dihydrofolate reductase